MRSFLFQESRKRTNKTTALFRPETMPACALFLLLYALGVSCGLACYDAGCSAHVLPAFSAAFAGGAWRMTLLYAMLYCLLAAALQAASMLLTGLSAWLLPFWAVCVLLRALTVGLCAALCLDALRMAVPSADLLVAGIAAAFIVPFSSELRLGILPLVRSTEPGIPDAQDLAVGLRCAVQFLLLSVLSTAAAMLVLRHVLIA